MDPNPQLVRIEDLAEREKNSLLIRGQTFKEASTVVVVPTRGMVHHKVIQAWENMIAPMNQKRPKFYAVGDEVGIAYNKLIEAILLHPELSTYKYVMTLEDDNLPPRDAHLRLIQAIDIGPYAAVSGIYYTKGDITMPMAYGDPKEFERTGVLDFRPRDIAAIERTGSGNILEVNGIGMGCALWRMDVFREFAAPWFVSLQKIVPEKGNAVASATQDLYFCERLRRAGKRIAVDLRVKVGHLDIQTDLVY